MLNIVLTGLESATNKYLELDPDTIKRIGELSGKVIKLDIYDWNLQFYILPQPQGLELVDTYRAKVDTSIRGKLINLVSISAQGATGSALFENQIDIEGDTDTGEKMRDILQKIDIDWEEHLSRCVGDVAAHKVAEGARDSAGFAKHAAKSLCDNITEYLKHEAKILPSKQQLENYYCDVNTLRDDVERMEARVTRLKGNADA